MAADIADAGVKGKDFHTSQHFPIFLSLDFFLDFLHKFTLFLNQQLISDKIVLLCVYILLQKSAFDLIPILILIEIIFKGLDFAPGH